MHKPGDTIEGVSFDHDSVSCLPQHEEVRGPEPAVDTQKTAILTCSCQSYGEHLRNISAMRCKPGLWPTRIVGMGFSRRNGNLNL